MLWTRFVFQSCSCNQIRYIMTWYCIWVNMFLSLSPTLVAQTENRRNKPRVVLCLSLSLSLCCLFCICRCRLHR